MDFIMLYVLLRNNKLPGGLVNKLNRITVGSLR